MFVECHQFRFCLMYVWVCLMIWFRLWTFGRKTTDVLWYTSQHIGPFSFFRFTAFKKMKLNFAVFVTVLVAAHRLLFSCRTALVIPRHVGSWSPDRGSNLSPLHGRWFAPSTGPPRKFLDPFCFSNEPGPEQERRELGTQWEEAQNLWWVALWLWASNTAYRLKLLHL